MAPVGPQTPLSSGLPTHCPLTQLSLVQGLLSSQLGPVAATPWQPPSGPPQVSPVVQGLPSSQTAPGAGVPRHNPLLSQASLLVHG